MPKAIVWFRQDLRLSDNPALVAACKAGDILPVYIEEETDSEFGALGAASKWWLHHSLNALSSALGGMVLRRGDPQSIIPDLVEETGADAVFWNRCYDGHSVERDKSIKSALKDNDVTVETFNGALLFEPWEITTKQGGQYKVFTPYWRAIKSEDPGSPQNKPRDISLAELPDGDRLEDWGLLPKNPDWAEGWEDIWTPGEEGASRRLDNLIQSRLKNYGKNRDLPAENATSLLSPHLRFGEISPRQIWARVRFAGDEHSELTEDANKFLSELAWRDFSHHLLWQFPELPQKNWKSDFNQFNWRYSEKDLECWRRGKTGYPMVDAGMRELWATGYMHNRVRMITASFLVKHLRIDWRRGEEWFWDTLVDADLANNSANWQWVAGSGADASPYFRIFNPMTQGEKFDPEGDYVRQWCPELKDLETQYLHAPWQAPQEALDKAGIELGTTYPKPMVEHKKAREAALSAYQDIKDD